mmetsp:Transcript_18775/g.43638  ORF Transcript_18775/g.43638 Transcript_18775/m.43638 type:complete len:231 (+) Transcript_18775:1769-2461(+)
MLARRRCTWALRAVMLVRRLRRVSCSFKRRANSSSRSSCCILLASSASRACSLLASSSSCDISTGGGDGEVLFPASCSDGGADGTAGGVSSLLSFSFRLRERVFSFFCRRRAISSSFISCWSLRAISSSDSVASLGSVAISASVSSLLWGGSGVAERFLLVSSVARNCSFFCNLRANSWSLSSCCNLRAISSSVSCVACVLLATSCGGVIRLCWLRPSVGAGDFVRLFWL